MISFSEKCLAESEFFFVFFLQNLIRLYLRQGIYIYVGNLVL
jgi:hypothetical protein